MKKLGILLVLLAPFAHAGESAPAKIRAAYKNGAGEWIVELARENGESSYLWGDRSALFEQNVTWKSKSDELADYVFSGADVSMSGEKAQVSCESGAESEYLRASRLELAELQKRLDSRKAKIRALPAIEDPAFLLQLARTGELIYITAPRFNFHGKYTIFRGRPGHLHKVETAEKSGEIGLIRFKNGGGVYIPSTIELFGADSKDRGAPFLLETANAKPETLVRPSLTVAELKALGVRRIKGPRLRSPCDPLRTEVASRALGDGT